VQNLLLTQVYDSFFDIFVKRIDISYSTYVYISSIYRTYIYHPRIYIIHISVARNGSNFRSVSIDIFVESRFCTRVVGLCLKLKKVVTLLPWGGGIRTLACLHCTQACERQRVRERQTDRGARTSADAQRLVCGARSLIAAAFATFACSEMHRKSAKYIYMR
jgi:hypothetical protein